MGWCYNGYELFGLFQQYAKIQKENLGVTTEQLTEIHGH